MVSRKITNLNFSKTKNEDKGMTVIQRRLFPDEVVEATKLKKQLKTKEKKKGVHHPKNILNDLTGTEWIQETSTIWFQRGLGQESKHAEIERKHPAPFPYLMIERLVKFFTKKNELVLDPFCGVASTLKACALNHRKGVGVELSQKWIELSKERLKLEANNSKDQRLIKGDARKILSELDNKSFDFVVTSPPYWQILNKKADHKVVNERIKKNLETNYSDDKNDLGNIEDYQEFLNELKVVFQGCYRLLKNKKYAVIVVSDFRHKSTYVAYHIDIIRMMENIGFVTKGITILVQNAKKLYPYGYPYGYVPNIHHQYILIFQKTE